MKGVQSSSCDEFYDDDDIDASNSFKPSARASMQARKGATSSSVAFSNELSTTAEPKRLTLPTSTGSKMTSKIDQDIDNFGKH